MCSRIVFISLAIMTMVMIFFFSSETGGVSGKHSGGITRFLLSHLWPGFGGMAQTERAALEAKASFFIRKAAHFTEYGLLSTFLMLSLVSTGALEAKGGRWCAVTSWLFSTLYACTDEFHQSFVDGRGPGLRDVAIDSIGALVAVALVLFFISKRKNTIEK